MYAVNDKVRLTAARGGWDGYVSAILGGPGGGALYMVHSIKWSDPDEGQTLAAEGDIAQTLTPAVFEVGDTVTLYGRSGEVVTVHGDSTYSVRIDWTVNNHLTLSRIHRVPLWRIAQENEV